MDKFTDFLSAQTEKFDTDIPGENVWENIQHTMVKRERSRPVKYITRFAAAACIAALIVTGIWLVNRKSNDRHNDEKLVSAPPARQVPIEDTAVLKNQPVISSRPVETIVKAQGTPPKPQQGTTKEISAGYASLISSRLQKLRTTPVYAECKDYFSDFAMQLKKMDQDELNIQNDLERYGMEEGLIDQLIGVYDRKLKLLKDLQFQITRMNRKAGTRSNSSRQSTPCFLNI